MSDISGYIGLIVITIFIVIVFLLGDHLYKDARRRDEALIKKYGSVDKIPSNERKDGPYL